MLNCRQFLDELCDYVDGGKVGIEAERHLARCRKCRILCETTRQMVQLYHRRAAGCLMPEDVHERLVARLMTRMAGPPQSGDGM